jgi:hypothetical protein
MFQQSSCGHVLALQLILSSSVCRRLQALGHEGGSHTKEAEGCFASGTSAAGGGKCQGSDSSKAHDGNGKHAPCKAACSKSANTSVIEMSDTSDDSDLDEVVCTSLEKGKGSTKGKVTDDAATENDSDAFRQDGLPVSVVQSVPRIYYATRTHSQIAQVLLAGLAEILEPLLAVFCQSFTASYIGSSNELTWLLLDHLRN